MSLTKRNVNNDNVAEEVLISQENLRIVKWIKEEKMKEITEWRERVS